MQNSKVKTRPVKTNRYQKDIIKILTFNIISSLLISPAHAIVLTDGKTGYVTENSTRNLWEVRGATLNVRQGGKTQGITLRGGVLNMEGGDTYIEPDARQISQAISLQDNSQATINNSTIINAMPVRGVAIGVNGGSEATVTSSVLNANGRGFTTSGLNSLLVLNDSVVNGKDDGLTSQFGGGIGGTIFGGTLQATNSAITGDKLGLMLLLDDDDSQPVAILNNTHITSSNGSAILAGARSSYSTGVIGLQINAGSVLTAGNGTLVEVINGNTLNLSIDNSDLSGNLIADQTSVLNTVLNNNAALHGNIENLNTLVADKSELEGNIAFKQDSVGLVQLKNNAKIQGDINGVNKLEASNSSITGNINPEDTRPADVALRDNSIINGDVRNINTLTLAHSTIIGRVFADSPGFTAAELSDDSLIEGNLSQISSLSLNASRITGDIIGSEDNATTVSLANKSAIEGNLTLPAAVTLDNSRITGDITGSETYPTTVSLASGSVIDGNLNAIHTLALQDSQLTGNVTADGTTGSSVSLSGKTSLLGNLENYDSISVRDNAMWSLIQSANIRRLALSSGSVNLNSQGNNYRTLTVNNLVGQGLFLLRSDIAANKGDQLIIDGQTSGSHLLSITNTGEEPDHSLPLTVVRTADGGGDFSLQNGRVDAGVYEYRLQHQGNDWDLLKTEELTPSTETVLSVVNATPAVWTGELNTVRGRLGDLRTTAKHDGGLWAQYMGQETHVSPGGGISYQQKQSGLAIGGDKAFDVREGKLLTGLFTGYSDNDINAHYGNSNIDSYFIGGYTTWMADSGWFVDLMLKGNKFHNNVEATMSNGVASKGNYNNYGIGFSSEFGKNILLSQGWFIEPSLQLSSLWMSGKEFKLDNGLKVSNDSAKSKQAALNMALGKNLTLDNGMSLSPYVRVSYQHEFAKANDVSVNDIAFKNDMSGGNGMYEVGLNAQVSDKAYIYTDASYSKGNKVESPWATHVGVRINW